MENPVDGIKHLKLTCNSYTSQSISIFIDKYKINRPTVTTTLKNLVALYRKQGRSEAADQLDNCAVKIKRDVSCLKNQI
jgi:hypothetical protein